jgi:hypothetical protein
MTFPALEHSHILLASQINTFLRAIEMTIIVIHKKMGSPAVCYLLGSVIYWLGSDETEVRGKGLGGLRGWGQ